MDTQVQNGSQQFTVADGSGTGLRCSCGHFLSESEAAQMVEFFQFGESAPCHSCGNPAYAVSDYETCILADSIPFLDKGVTKSQSWFHATTVPNWHEKVTNLSEDLYPEDLHHDGRDETLLVHLGTMESAWKRFKDLYTDYSWEESQQWTLYEVEIAADAVIADDVVADADDDAPTRAYECSENYQADGVTRYLNSYEIPGSISLLANTHSFRIVDAVPLTKADLG